MAFMTSIIANEFLLQEYQNRIDEIMRNEPLYGFRIECSSENWKLNLKSKIKQSPAKCEFKQMKLWQTHTHAHTLTHKNIAKMKNKSS